jgi:hypothetical protein
MFVSLSLLFFTHEPSVFGMRLYDADGSWLLFRVLHQAIIDYVIRCAIVYKKGYQGICVRISSE